MIFKIPRPRGDPRNHFGYRRHFLESSSEPGSIVKPLSIAGALSCFVSHLEDPNVRVKFELIEAALAESHETLGKV